MIRYSVLLVLFYSVAQFGYAQKPKDKIVSTSKPFVLGTVEEIQSTILAEKRTLNIYLPEGYNPQDTVTYPVIYLLDGSADEDFIHVVGLVQFNSFSWVNQVPKSIVVGIANVDRRRDFTYQTTISEDLKRNPTSGQSEKFISFLEKELQPWVAGKYKTNRSQTLIGQSLGGLLATEILFKKPQLFTHYIIISPSLWWDNGSLLQQSPALLQKDFSMPIRIYVGVGKEGLTPTKISHVMEVDANLLAEKLKNSQNPNVSTYFDYLPEENHATIGHQALLNAFRVMYSKVMYSNKK